MSFLERFRSPRANVAEIIQRVYYAVASPWLRAGTLKTIDETVPDYAFWDKLRRGKLTGYKLGGLFCIPITQIVASYVFGNGPTLKLADSESEDGTNDRRVYTNDLLARWMMRERAFFTTALVDMYGLGDQFLIVNPDGSLSAANPDTVTITRDLLDYRTVTAYTITTRTDDLTITDQYRLDGRTVTLEWHKAFPDLGVTAGQKQVFEYANLIGRLPVIHWSNDQASNETHGRPIYEPLLRMFSRYDDLLEKALDGAELMGNPIPVFEGMENIAETINANATTETATYTDSGGTEQSRKVLRFDRLAAVFVGKGGRFEFKAPSAGFTADIRDMLKSLFLLMLDHARVPEFLWGGAIASSKASAEVQMPPFARYIDMRRVMLEGRGADEVLGVEARGGLLEVADVWLRTRALIDPRVVVAPVVVAQWPEITSTDDALTFEKIKYADGTGKLTDETALMLLDLVDDPGNEVEKAQAEAEEAEQRRIEATERLMMAGGSTERDAEANERQAQEAA